MTKIFKIFFIFCLFFVADNVFAVCSDSMLKENTKNAQAVKIEYQNIKDFRFKMIVHNLSKDMFIIDDNSGVRTYGTGKTQTLNLEFADGFKYDFRVFMTDGECKNLRLATISVTTPAFNYYSLLDGCIENPDFKLCDPWYDGYISDESFNEELGKYLSDEDVSNSNMNESDIILDFLNSNLLLISGGSFLFLIFVGSLIYLILRKRKSKVNL